MKSLNKNSVKYLLCTMLIAVCVLCGISAFSASNTLKFVHMTDVHLSDMKLDTKSRVLSNSFELFNDEINQIKGINGLDFVMVTGDMTNSPNKEMIDVFDKKMNTLKSPWYSTFGNHDISVHGEITKERYVQILRKNNPNYKFEKSYYSFVPKKGFRVIALDSIIDNELTCNGRLPLEQLIWLENELSKSKKNNEVPLIFLHHPLHPPYITEKSGKMSRMNHEMRSPQDFYNVLNKYNMPVAIFSGHFHAAKIYKEGNILHVSTPALVCYPNAFREVTITSDKDKVTFKLDFHETNLKDIQEKAKSLVSSPEKNSGTDPDRNAVIVIDK